MATKLRSPEPANDATATQQGDGMEPGNIAPDNPPGEAQEAAATESAVAAMSAAVEQFLKSDAGRALLAEAIRAATPMPAVLELRSAGGEPSAIDSTQAAQAVGIHPSKVFSFADYPDRIVVVTSAGQKLTAAKGQP